MIVTVSVAGSLLVQGALVRLLPGGRAVVDLGVRTASGKLLSTPARTGCIAAV